MQVSGAEQAAIEYYHKKFGKDANQAFVHFAKEMGEFARGLEKGNAELMKLEATEMAALLLYFASLQGFDLLGNVAALYKKKLETVSL